jgi:hypothetical protein
VRNSGKPELRCNPSLRKKMDARVKPAHDVERVMQLDRNPL